MEEGAGLPSDEGEFMIKKSNCRHLISWINVVIVAGCFVTMPGCQKTGPLYEIEVRNPHAEDFVEVHEVGMNEEFKVGDTNYSAMVIRFEPDFTIDLDTKEVVSRSQDMNNPAILLEIYENGNKVVEQWVFRKEMPHMSRKTPISFALLTVDGEGGAQSPEPAEPRLGLPAGHIPVGTDSSTAEPRLRLPAGHIPVGTDSSTAAGSGH
jgi:hypothetical protein